jgi:uncharacterized protein
VRHPIRRGQLGTDIRHASLRAFAAPSFLSISPAPPPLALLCPALPCLAQAPDTIHLHGAPGEGSCFLARGGGIRPGSMSGSTLVEFLVLAGIAAYVQTLTGFAFGLITMGGIGLSGMLDLPDAAVLVSTLTLTNALQMLARGWRLVAWRQLGLVMLGSLPCLFVGFALLRELSGSRSDLLRLILGVTVVVSSLQLLSGAARRDTLSSNTTFVVFGGIAGLMSGLFSTGGPPVVYHLHRQPLQREAVRETLVAIFAFNALLRLSIVAGSGTLPPSPVWWGLLAVPAVAGATHLARRWPPPLSRAAMRYVVVALLLLSGVALAAPALLHLAAPR